MYEMYNSKSEQAITSFYLAGKQFREEITHALNDYSVDFRYVPL